MNDNQNALIRERILAISEAAAAAVACFYVPSFLVIAIYLGRVERGNADQRVRDDTPCIILYYVLLVLFCSSKAWHRQLMGVTVMLLLLRSNVEFWRERRATRMTSTLWSEMPANYHAAKSCWLLLFLAFWLWQVVLAIVAEMTALVEAARRELPLLCAEALRLALAAESRNWQ